MISGTDEPRPAAMAASGCSGSESPSITGMNGIVLATMLAPNLAGSGLAARASRTVA